MHIVFVVLEPFMNITVSTNNHENRTVYNLLCNPYCCSLEDRNLHLLSRHAFNINPRDFAWNGIGVENVDLAMQSQKLRQSDLFSCLFIICSVA